MCCWICQGSHVSVVSASHGSELEITLTQSSTSLQERCDLLEIQVRVSYGLGELTMRFLVVEVCWSFVCVGHDLQFKQFDMDTVRESKLHFAIKCCFPSFWEWRVEFAGQFGHWRTKLRRFRRQQRIKRSWKMRSLSAWKPWNFRLKNWRGLFQAVWITCFLIVSPWGLPKPCNRG